MYSERNDLIFATSSGFQSSMSSGYTMSSRSSEYSVPSSPRVSGRVYIHFFWSSLLSVSQQFDVMIRYSGIASNA